MSNEVNYDSIVEASRYAIANSGNFAAGAEQVAYELLEFTVERLKRLNVPADDAWPAISAAADLSGHINQAAERAAAQEAQS